MSNFEERNYTTLRNYEKVERLFFQLGKFTLKNVVLLNNSSNANNEKRKLDVIYKRDYPSTKYNNMEQLSQLKIKTSDFLVFAYTDYSVKPIVSEEIFTSYNHLNSVMDFFANIDEQIIQQEDLIYNDEATNLTEYGQNLAISSEPLVQGKMMTAIPVINVDGSNNIIHGVAIFFDNQNYYEIFNFKNIYGLIDTLNQINLPTISGQSLIIAMLDAIERKTRYSGGYKNNNQQYGNQNEDDEYGQTQDTRFLRRNIPTSGGSSNIPRRGLNNTRVQQPQRPVFNRETNSSSSQPTQDTKPTQTVSQQPSESVNSQSTNSKRRIGINDIKKVADQIDVSDLSNVDEIDI